MQISCIVEQTRANDAVEALHKVFGLDSDVIDQLDSMMEAFYNESGSTDIMIIGGLFSSVIFDANSTSLA